MSSETINVIIADDFEPITVGIAGGSGGGKTTLALSLYEALGKETNITYVMHDNYYKDITHLSVEERACTNFDHPDSLDTDLMIEHIRDLKQNKSVEIPNYDFNEHARTSETTTTIPRKIILVEGILIFANPILVDLLDIKIYVDTDADIRFMRRVKRDMTERGRSMESVIEQYMKTVRPMHNEFVEPSKQVADVIFPARQTNTQGLEMLINHLKVKANLL